MVPDVATLAAVHEESLAFVAFYDAGDRLIYANAAYREMFFVGETEKPYWPDLMRRNWELKRGTVVGAKDFESWITSVMSRRGKVPKRAFESDVMDGRWLWITETILPDGGMMFIAFDITALRAGERELRQSRDVADRAAQTDDLTGVSNRRHIMSFLDDVLAGRDASRSRRGCVALLDIDHFKRINDGYGHQAGDQVLIHFARTVRADIRLCDGFGRVGGEEFMMVLPGVSVEQGQELVQRALGVVRRAPLPGRLIALRFTCSAGLAALREGDSVDTVFARADAALYEAKNAGRDRLNVAA